MSYICLCRKYLIPGNHKFLGNFQNFQNITDIFWNFKDTLKVKFRSFNTM
uniref:Uncharacterized protein n=1 Tax=Ostreococcus mediterraneus virus 2 TaxID=2726183 RepID=A0A6H1QTS1_9PHYC|nr:hypothetical protein orf00001 [Ostreococcus mediterraneus virus 2]